MARLRTIIKIGSLLALGFGEAGAEIIGQNMRGGDSAALNAMIPGRRVEADDCPVRMAFGSFFMGFWMVFDGFRV